MPRYEISPIQKGGREIIDKLNLHGTIRDYYNLKNGLNPGNIKHILISDKRETDNHKPIVWGKEVSPYQVNWGGQYVNYNVRIGDNLTIDNIKSKPGMNKAKKIDFALRTSEMFECSKILVRKTGDKFIASVDHNNYYFDTLVHGVYKKTDDFKLEYLLGILNSKSATQFYRLLHDIKGKVFAKISLDKLGDFPIPDCDDDQKAKIIGLVNSISEMTRAIEIDKNKFLSLLTQEFQVHKLTKKCLNGTYLNGRFLLKNCLKMTLL